MPDNAPVVLVTGSARRIGAAICTHLHAHGFRVAMHGFSSGDALAALAAQADARRPHSAAALHADLREADAPQRLVDEVLHRFGRLDALVNNASNFFPTPVGEATPQQWDALFAVNARAPFFLMQAAAPHLRERNGAVVNLTDLHAGRPRRDYPIYSAAKAALAMLTQAMALELAPEVRVNAVAPGAILWPQPEPPEAARQALLARTPLARIGTVEEVAEAVRWLLQDAGYITGHTLALDGGRRLT